MKITCKHCKNEVDVSMYFYDAQIISTTHFFGDQVLYDAAARGKAICPLCGCEINEYFCSMISSSEIVTLAIRKELANEKH